MISHGKFFIQVRVRTRMATKTITITEESYERLAARKEAHESFSDVVNKLTRGYSLLDLVGILSKKEADELETHIKKRRKSMRERMSEIARELND